jgi:hypothetical protein
LTPKQIADRWAVSEGKVRSVLSNLRQLGYLPPLSPEEQQEEDLRKKAVKNASRRKERGRYVRSNGPLPVIERKDIMAKRCFAHWRDLAKHHPTGFGSIRVTRDKVISTTGSASQWLSLTGSSADMCAGA